MARGGARVGAGRKPKDESGPGTQVSVWLSPRAQEELRDATQRLKVSGGDVLEWGLAVARRKLKKLDAGGA